MRGEVEQTSRLTCDRIMLRLVGEGENIGGEEDGGRRLRVARRLGKAIVEAAATRSADVCENSIESDPSLFICVEALVEQVAQEASILGDALAINALCWSYRIATVLRVGGEIEDGSKAASGDDRVRDDVDVLIYFARLESAVQMDEPITGGEFAIGHVSELPLGAGNHRSRRRGEVADG